MTEAGRIHVGVGGWNFEPWRANFYPAGLAHSRELAFASRRLSAIEINSTYYGTQKRASFAKWRDDTPEGFVFTLKASRYSTQRRSLAESGESIERFVNSGIAELGPKLGPIVWQLPTSKAFDPDDLAAFFGMLPKQVEGVPLRHTLEARHASFMVPEYLALARRFGVATVYTDSPDYPSFGDLTGDFVYARLMQSQADLPRGYADTVLDRCVDGARAWARGAEPEGMGHVEDHGGTASGERGRDVFIFFINGAKERAPHAAGGLLERLGFEPRPLPWSA